MRNTLKKRITKGFLLFLFTFFSVGVQAQWDEYGDGAYGNTEEYNDGYINGYYTGGTYVNGTNQYGVTRTYMGNGPQTWYADSNGGVVIVSHPIYSYSFPDTSFHYNPYANYYPVYTGGSGVIGDTPPCTLTSCQDGRVVVNCACVVNPCDKKISKTYLLERSEKYGIPKEAAMAIYDVETGGKPFRQNGDPKVLFERHRFSILTNGQYDSSNPNISNPIKGGYGTENSQLSRLREAYALNPSAAIKSASYGGFQIMGFNYKLAGYTDMTKFYNDMTSTNVNLHLDAFFEYAKNKGLINDINNQNWDAVAKGYNGKAYNAKDSFSKNYDKKFKEAFNKYINNPSLISAKDCL